MVSTIDYVVWIISGVSSLLTVGITIRNGEATRYLTLNIYLLACVAVSTASWFVIRAFGFTSLEYVYFYFYTDSLLSVLLYFVLMSFYEDVFEEIHTTRKMRLVTLLVLVATAWVSFTIVQSHKDHMTTRFALELGRNLNFLGLLLTCLLRWAYVRTPEQSRRLLQLISALGIYFSVFVIYFVVRMTTHSSRFVSLVPPLLACWLPLGWAYAFVKIPGRDRVLMPANRRQASFGFRRLQKLWRADRAAARIASFVLPRLVFAQDASGRLDPRLQSDGFVLGYVYGATGACLEAFGVNDQEQARRTVRRVFKRLFPKNGGWVAEICDMRSEQDSDFARHVQLGYSEMSDVFRSGGQKRLRSLSDHMRTTYLLER